MSNNLPNLINPDVSRQIVDNLKPPPPVDYWEPTRNSMKTFFDKYVKPNWLVLLVIVIIIVFLLYRMRHKQKNKEQRLYENFHKSKGLRDDLNQQEIDRCSRIVLDSYRRSYEGNLEPKTVSKRAVSSENSASNRANLAYPLYPNMEASFYSPRSRRVKHSRRRKS